MSADGGTDDGDEYVCGSTDTGTGDPCQFPVAGPDQRCHHHPKDGSPPPGTGKSDPGHRMGNGDGKIQERLPDNAKPAMKHGVHAVKNDPHGTLDWLESNDPKGYDWVRSKWSSFLADAPFDASSSKSDEVLHACLMLYAVRGVRHRQVSRGLSHMVTHYTDDGGQYEQEEELPVNLPANRMAREARSMLKDLGLLDDPESKKAQAMGWTEAARNVAMEIDSEPDDDD